MSVAIAVAGLLCLLFVGRWIWAALTATYVDDEVTASLCLFLAAICGAITIVLVVVKAVIS